MTVRRWIALSAAALLAAVPAARAGDEALIRLLEKRRCVRCNLADADLVHADLRDADLQGSQLQRANLSQARLDGARLNGADLGFTSLLGASLRGADLRGARLEGTDLRQADLSGALLDPGALSRTHWQQARGLSAGALSYGELHNAGVDAAQAGRHPEAERWFSDAIARQPDAAISWVARGISRNEQGNVRLAVADFNYAASLYRARGEESEATTLEQASKALANAPKSPKGGNGAGGQLVGGAVAAIRMLAPLALKVLMPLGL
ncbi:MAG: pentapeptide repeat-containing protein [Cyanobacteriota bacterium]